MKDFVLHHIYKTASIVEDSLEFGLSLDLTSKKDVLYARQRASVFSKDTLLHLFIKQEFVDYYNHFFTEMTESVCDEFFELESLEEQFSCYDVPINFLRIKYDEEEYYPITTNSQIIWWYKRNKKKFNILSDKVCPEIFHIIFSNKMLLHRFNENLATNFDKFNFNKYQLTEKGTLKRVAIPKWLQNAVFHRDKGRCSLCWTDLTKIDNLDAKNNFDHIIPLDLFGVNDPTNIQLVCKECNLKKLNKNTEVGTKYQEWFM